MTARRTVPRHSAQHAWLANRSQVDCNPNTRTLTLTRTRGTDTSRSIVLDVHNTSTIAVATVSVRAHDESDVRRSRMTDPSASASARATSQLLPPFVGNSDTLMQHDTSITHDAQGRAQRHLVAGADELHRASSTLPSTVDPAFMDPVYSPFY